MKLATTIGAALLLAIPMMMVTSGVASAIVIPSSVKPATTTTVVAPGERKSAGHVTVTNGNYNEQYPLYAGSNGKMRIKPTTSGTEVKCDGSVKGKIEDIKSGDTVIVSTNSSPVDISGTGGTVSVGGGSTVNITNTGSTGGTNIIATTPGGSTITILPGMTVPIQG